MPSLTTFLKARGARTAVAVASAALALSTAFVGSNPTGADPKQYSAFVGTGSDTTQDIMNALAGEANGKLYDPVRSSAASGGQQIISWDATGTACITPKAPGATFQRPNGSSNGRRALSRAIDGGLWGTGCGGAKATGGLVHFARSSSGPSAVGTGQLTYVPFGRDAVGFAYYANDVETPVTTLTSAQLQSLYQTGPAVINDVLIIPCSIQEGSGTYEFWLSKLDVSFETADEATEDCGDPMQENDAAALAARGAEAEFEGAQLIIGFSAANFISQSNGVAASQLAPGVDLGAIDDLGQPYVDEGTHVEPSETFYASEVYGRDVYNVLSSQVVDLPGNTALKSIFIGVGADEPVLCTEDFQIIVNQFGFLSVDHCGDTTVRGSLL